MRQLVALTGRAGSGKTFCSRLFEDQGYIRIKFADSLKDMLRAILRNCGVPQNQIERYIEGDLKELPTHYLMGRSPRFAMQTLGNEWGRKTMDPDFWVSLTYHRIKAALEAGKKVVVDDCRYDNEAMIIENLGGYVVKIDGRRPTVTKPDHESERGVSNYLITDTLNNTGDVSLTKSEVMRISNGN